MRIEDKVIFSEIKKGNKKVYEALFNDYYSQLIEFAKSFLFDQQESEDIVQELFVHIWENAQKINIETSVKSYFYQSIRNKCLNRLKSLKVKDKNNLLYMDAVINSGDDLKHFDSKLLTTIMQSIDELPEQMGKVFKMKMLDGESREAIAEELNVSINTVKTQLQRAKAKLREKLLDNTNLYFFL